MRITALGHAAALVELRSGARLLLDPWLEDPAYFHSWWHFPPLRRKIADLGRVDGVYLSHDHPDHCDPKTLRQLPRDTEMLIAAFESRAVDRILEGLGFTHVRRMPFRAPFEWRGAEIECVRTDLPWEDSSLRVTDAGTTVFDMNDCKLHDATLDALGREWKVDVALLPYSGAIQFPTCYEMDARTKLELCARRRVDHLRLFVDRAKRLRPRHAVPFAAGYCLPSPEQWWMNDVNNITSPADALAKLAEEAPRAHDGGPVRGLLLLPGDAWDPERGAQPAGAPVDWSRQFEVVREHARSIASEVAAARAEERDPEPGLASRFHDRFARLLEEQRELASRAAYRVVFDVRGAQGFVAHLDLVASPPRVAEGDLAESNLRIRIPSSMLDAVLDGRITWDE
ncbi:MAG TPA: MBL fold metallo-hydrolase, partial [Planctomycetota bacterium]|nr:MBL fold metallo-hydrolase [Planctomycetota bacterium]